MKEALYVVVKGSVQQLDINTGQEWPPGKSFTAGTYFGHEQLCKAHEDTRKQFNRLLEAHSIPLSDCSRMRLNVPVPVAGKEDANNAGEDCELIYLEAATFIKQVHESGELHKLEDRKREAGISSDSPGVSTGKAGNHPSGRPQSGVERPTSSAHPGESGMKQPASAVTQKRALDIHVEFRMRLFTHMVICAQHFHPDAQVVQRERACSSGLPMSWLTNLCDLLSESTSFQMQSNAVRALAMLSAEKRIAEQIAADPKIVPRLYELMAYAPLDETAASDGGSKSTTKSKNDKKVKIEGDTTLKRKRSAVDIKAERERDLDNKIGAAYSACTCIRWLAEVAEARDHIRRRDTEDRLAWMKKGGLLELLWKRRWALEVEVHLVRTVWLLLRGTDADDHGAKRLLLGAGAAMGPSGSAVGAKPRNPVLQAQLHAVVRMLEPQHTANTRAMAAGVVLELCGGVRQPTAAHTHKAAEQKKGQKSKLGDNKAKGKDKNKGKGAASKFRVGERVEADWQGRDEHEEWGTGMIAKVNTDGTFDVIYDYDASTETGVQAKAIRSVEPRRALSPEEERERVLVRFGFDSMIEFHGVNVIELLATIDLEEVSFDELELHELSTTPVRALLRLLESSKNKQFAWTQKDTNKAYAILRPKNKKSKRQQRHNHHHHHSKHHGKHGHSMGGQGHNAAGGGGSKLWQNAKVEVDDLFKWVNDEFHEGCCTPQFKNLVKKAVETSCREYEQSHQALADEGGDQGLLILTHRIDDVAPADEHLAEFVVAELDVNDEDLAQMEMGLPGNAVSNETTTRDDDGSASVQGTLESHLEGAETHTHWLLLQSESCSTAEGLVAEAMAARRALKAKIAPHFVDWCDTEPDRRPGEWNRADQSVDMPQDWIDAAYDPGVRSVESCAQRVASSIDNKAGFREVYDAAY
eukprot:g2817.t1